MNPAIMHSQEQLWVNYFFGFSGYVISSFSLSLHRVRIEALRSVWCAAGESSVVVVMLWWSGFLAPWFGGQTEVKNHIARDFHSCTAHMVLNIFHNWTFQLRSLHLIDVYRRLKKKTVKGVGGFMLLYIYLWHHLDKLLTLAICQNCLWCCASFCMFWRCL